MRSEQRMKGVYGSPLPHVWETLRAGKMIGEMTGRALATQALRTGFNGQKLCKTMQKSQALWCEPIQPVLGR